MFLLSVLIHFTGAVQFAYTTYYICKHVEVPNTPRFSNLQNPFGGHFKYLTFLNILSQMIYYHLALLYDMFDFFLTQPTFLCALLEIRDYWFAAFAFPMALFVSVLFWSLYAIDRELIHPKIMDTFIPGWLNHLMHTNVAVYAMLEMCCISNRNYPKRDVALLGHYSFSIAYVIWLHVVRYYSGLWVYPVLNVVAWPLRCVFYALAILLGSCFFFLGEYLDNVLLFMNESKEL